MKKLICSIMCLIVMFLLFICPAYAEESLSTEMQSILLNTMSETQYATLLNTEKYNGYMKEYDLTGKPAVLIYIPISWSELQLPMEEIFSDENVINSYYYGVLYDGKILKVAETASGEIATSQYGKDIDISEISWLGDLFYSSPQMVLKGQECTVNKVYCYDGSPGNDGIAVYLSTDKGVFVKYYEYPSYKAVVYTEEEFRTYAKSYYEYISSYENNYDEDGNLIIPVKVSLISFINEIYDGSDVQGESDVQGKTTAPNSYLGIYISIALVALAAVVIVVFFCCFKNKA